MTEFIPRQVTRTYTQTLAATPERILPLLTPEGERDWAERWDPTVLFAAPGRDGTGRESCEEVVRCGGLPVELEAEPVV